MAIAHNSQIAQANQLLKKGWVHHFVPLGVNLPERLSWLVDQYGLPIGEFDPVVPDEFKTWMLVRMEDGFKRELNFPHDYLLMFEDEQMRMMYMLRFSE